MLLGAGQLARAVAVELAAAGAAGLAIVNRTEARAGELAALLSGKFSVPVSAAAWQGDYAVPPEAEILIHATSLGHGAGDARLPLVVGKSAAGVAGGRRSRRGPRDVALGEARARGCKTIDGLSTFIEQLAIGVQLWTGVDPNRQIMREAAEEFWDCKSCRSHQHPVAVNSRTL